jgi:membrane-associated phospholipid phosphatase
LLAAAYLAGLAVLITENGVPEGRVELLLLTVAGLYIATLGTPAVGDGRSGGRLLRIVRDWLPFTAVLIGYDLSRHVATVVSLPLHETDVAAAERWLFGGITPTVWLQDHFYDPSVVHWYDAAASVVYSSHFVVTPILAAALWLRNRGLWLAYLRRVIVLSVAGLVTYVLFPEAPPWYAARDGVIAPVARVSARGWRWLHVGDVDSALGSAQRGGANPVAAMPSLHEAFAVLAVLFLLTQLRSRWGVLLWLYPAAMAIALVYTGEHYVLDLLAGAVFAVVTHAVVLRWEQRRAGAERGEPAAGALSADEALAVA